MVRGEEGIINTIGDSNVTTKTITVRLGEDLKELLTKVAREAGQSRSEIVRQSLRRHLRVSRFESLRRRIMPFAEARGYLVDEDVFRRVS